MKLPQSTFVVEGNNKNISWLEAIRKKNEVNLIQSHFRINEPGKGLGIELAISIIYV